MTFRSYAPANECIYCGKREEPLSKEHIIPYALGGNLTLPRASCAKHRDITSAIEGRVAREIYGFYRDSEGIQTRHTSRRDQRKTARVTLHGTTFADQPCEILVPVANLPRLHISVHLPVPQILTGAPLTLGPVGSKVTAQSDPTRVQALLTAQNVKTLKVEAGMQVETFLRVLAKIAHAFASAECGPGSFDPTLLALIEGRSNYLLEYVGAHNPEQRQAALPLVLERVAIREITYIVVHISLHSFPALPRYQVVAGRQIEAHES